MKTLNYQTPFYYANMDNSILLTTIEHRAYHKLLKENINIKKYSSAVYCYDVDLWRIFFNTPITTNEAFYLGLYIGSMLK